MSTFNLANLIKIVNPSANVDSYYGVWDNTTEAVLNVPIEVRQKGKTVGILDGSKVVEYWWQEGIQDSDLVPKGAEVDLSAYLTEVEINNLLNNYYTQSEVDQLLLNLDIDVDLTLEEDVPVQIDAGNIKVGDLLQEGLSFTDFVKLLFLATYEPTLIAPTYSLSNSVIGSREIGQSVNVTLTGNFNRGQIRGDIVNGAWNPNSIQAPRAGEASSFIFEGNSEATNNVSLLHTVVSGANVFNSSVNYQQGVQPLDSDGNNFNSPLAAGTLSASNNQLVGRYRQFFGAVASFPTTSSAVRSLSSNFTNTNSFQISISTTRFTIALPPGRTLTSVITANNENVTNNFSSTTLSVQDGGGNNVTYTLYNLQTALPLNVTAQVTIS